MSVAFPYRVVVLSLCLSGVAYSLNSVSPPAEKSPKGRSKGACDDRASTRDFVACSLRALNSESGKQSAELPTQEEPIEALPAKSASIGNTNQIPADGSATTPTEKAAPEAKIKFASAKEGELHTYSVMMGKVELDPHQSSEINARYAGVVKEIFKRAGEKVQQGTSLARIETNAAMQSFMVKSPVAGEIIQQDLSIGEYVDTDKTLYSVANVDTLWVSLVLKEGSLSQVKVGQRVLVADRSRCHRAQGQVFFVSPAMDPHTRTANAMVSIDNRDHLLLPGQYVDAFVEKATLKSPLVVAKSAVGRDDKHPFVYVKEKDRLVRKELKLGDEDLDFIAVLEGLKAGDEYLDGDAQAVAIYLNENYKEPVHDEENKEAGKKEADKG